MSIPEGCITRMLFYPLFSTIFALAQESELAAALDAETGFIAEKSIIDL